MINFYYKFFSKNYKSKINNLITDITKLLELNNIPINDENIIVLDDKFNKNINEKDWQHLNKLHNTLYNYSKLPTILNKFINKNQNVKNKKYKFIDTFAGCGGLSLGLTQAGFNSVFVNEIEPRFLETYYFNHSLRLDNYYCGDIKDIVNKPTIINDYSNIDLLVGGPPCQGFSMANRQPIIDDPRNKLYKSFLDMLSIVKPKFFIMENVKGMINKSDEIINNFNDILKNQYSLKMVLLNSKDFGIPQNRQRVIVIGSLLTNKVTANEIVQDILNNAKSYKEFILKDALLELPILKPKAEKNNNKIENDNIGFKFRKYITKNTQFKKFINNNENNDFIYNHINRYNNTRDIEIFNRLPQGENSLHHSISDIMPYSNRNHIFKDKYFKLDQNKVSKTITAHMKFDCNMYIHPTQPRGLSQRESARIQTFPDDYVFMGSNNTWYAQVGNAVPVKLAEVIGKNIIKYLK
ncbi:MAG: DNA cytosine methyltransferase [Epsilonproteobacteria bacterium]|nr:MAG: DNA cytosine methyltransferase [Campylobacterota bacterium]